MYRKKKETHIKGLIGEIEFTLYLITREWKVYKPVDQNSRIDLVIEKNGYFKKIQIKYCTPYKGCLRVELEHPIRKTGSYNIIEVDEIGVYDAKNKKFYLIPLVEILPRKEIWLRVDRTGNNQQKNVNWASKYEI